MKMPIRKSVKAVTQIIFPAFILEVDMESWDWIETVGLESDKSLEQSRNMCV